MLGSVFSGWHLSCVKESSWSLVILLILQARAEMCQAQAQDCLLLRLIEIQQFIYIFGLYYADFMLFR